MKDNFENKRQKEKRKQKRLLKELQSTEHGDCIGGEQWETIDMKKQLHPIGFYINDREEMIRQLFTVIHGERLKKMLPPVLKDVDFDELKADCLIHLVGMSSKRIKAILEGRDLDASSNESDSESDSVSVTAAGDSTRNSSAVIRPSASTRNSKQLLYDSCSADDTLEIEIDEFNSNFFSSNDDLISPRYKHKKIKRMDHQETVQQVEPRADVSDLQTGVECDLTELGSGANDGVCKKDENKGKTLLEILELEMRARAIRAILKRDNRSPSPVTPPQVKETGIDSISGCQAVSSSQSPTETELNVLEGGEATEKVNSLETNKNTSSDVINSKQQEINLNLIDGKSETKGKECNENNNDNDDVMVIDTEGSSWAQRWLEKKSKDVKRLVSTSKMCTTIRNKMKKSKLTSKRSSSSTDKCSQNHLIPSEFKGSIDEYRMLTKMTPGLQPLELDTSLHNVSEIQIQRNEKIEDLLPVDRS